MSRKTVVRLVDVCVKNIQYCNERDKSWTHSARKIDEKLFLHLVPIFIVYPFEIYFALNDFDCYLLKQQSFTAVNFMGRTDRNPVDGTGGFRSVKSVSLGGYF